MVFCLKAHQVPDFPDEKLWTEELHWLVCVMNRDDPAFNFIASLFSYALANEGLTERQAKAANKILARVQVDWLAGALDCQLNAQTVTKGISLEDLDVEGSA